MRQKLSELYKNEREEICIKLIKILNLDNNNCFLLSELDTNLEKQNEIINMKDEIKKYFECSTISSFKPKFKCKRPYLNIVRSILRKQNFIIEGNDYCVKYSDGLQKRTIMYNISRIN
jgi:hypothetical protein